MGIYLQYQAMPNGELLANCRRDAEIGEYLWSFHFRAEPDPLFYLPQTPKEQEFANLAIKTANAYPGIAKRERIAPKKFTSCYFLANAKNFQELEQPAWMRLIDASIIGDELISLSGQYPTRYFTITQIQLAIELIAKVLSDERKLQAYVSTIMIHPEPLYTLEEYIDTFKGLLAFILPFFKEVANHQEGVLVRLS